MPKKGQITPIETRFWTKIRKHDGSDPNWIRQSDGSPCWEWQGTIHWRNYGMIAGETTYDEATQKSKKQNFLAHRVAYQIQIGEIKEGLYVCHSCDHTLCVRGDHLFLGTAKDNSYDRDAKGRQAKGDTHGTKLHPGTVAKGVSIGNSKLTNAQVEEIRESYRTTEMSQQTIADKIGVSQTTVSAVIRGKTWKNVEKDTPDQTKKAYVLTKDQKIAICGSDKSRIELSKEYGVTPNTIWRVRRKGF
jgi:DNA-binding XRE family transcriptional regulator